ncbi:MAG: hypothetical protein KY457_05085 [Actinobacteria bacterium]|nr:hypothetical protein [Actinomycetota bacterium]
MIRTCPVCGGELERRVRGVGEVVTGAVSAVVEGAPVLACPQEHHVEELRPDLASVLATQVREDLLVSRRTRLRRQHRCGACDAELTIPGRRTVRSVSRRVEGVGVVRVTFDLPVLRCPACGSEQLPAEVAERDLGPAVRAALGPVSPGRP